MILGSITTKDWIIILIILIGFILLNFFIGLLFFLFSIPREKKTLELSKPVLELIDQNGQDIERLIELFLSEYETPLIDITPYIDAKNNPSEIGSKFFLQHTIAHIIKKDLDNEKKIPSDKLKGLLNKVLNSNKNNEEIINKYNKSAMIYNSLRKYIFARIFFTLAHKKTFNII